MALNGRKEAEEAAAAAATAAGARKEPTYVQKLRRHTYDKPYTSPLILTRAAKTDSQAMLLPSAYSCSHGTASRRWFNDPSFLGLLNHCGYSDPPPGICNCYSLIGMLVLTW